MTPENTEIENKKQKRARSSNFIEMKRIQAWKTTKTGEKTITCYIDESNRYYYNLDDNKSACITMDVDWAPDPVLEKVFEWFITNEIKITAFITHPSTVAKRMQSSEFIDIAIHPNFSQALNVNEKVVDLLKQC